MGALIYGAYYYHSKAKEARSYSNEEGYLVGKWVLIVIVFAFSWAPFGCLKDALKAYVAPRVAIVEKIQELVRDATSESKCGGK